MNLRQKNKKLKRELEMLKRQAVMPKFISYDRRGVITLRSKEIYDPSLFEFMPDDDINENAARSLIKEILPYASYETYTDPRTGYLVVSVSLNVVS